jgi:hypothetical protein
MKTNGLYLKGRLRASGPTDLVALLMKDLNVNCEIATQLSSLIGKITICVVNRWEEGSSLFTVTDTRERQ